MLKSKAVAIVGLGAVLPDAHNVQTFWQNILTRRYSISETPADRWRVDLYFDPNPNAVDKTYTKIGGWVKDYHFDPFKIGIAIPPRVLATMDETQHWAVAACHQALTDYGYPQRGLNPERVAVILGNALSGESHYRSTLRIQLPEFTDVLSGVPEFQNLPPAVQAALMAGVQNGMRSRIPDITEDTMPGELSNIIAGRVANVFNFSGPNYVTDAACASSLAAIQNSIDGLFSGQFDAVLTGGVDRNMGVGSFVKFCKIGALSPDGSRPYAEGANGFVMGEGATVFLLKRLEDAEKDGDRIYAVIRGVGGSSDGKGKGITAPNPVGQQRAIARAWQAAGLDPATVGLIEGHGTSTKVGDVTEVNSLNAVFGALGLPAGKIGLGSVKSNIGHLKSAAGAVGLLKMVMALNERILPPNANFERPNPNIDFKATPFEVITAVRPWDVRQGEVRRAGVSSFGFGGTNFHLVAEEYRPGVLTAEKIYPMSSLKTTTPEPQTASAQPDVPGVKPVRGMLFLSAESTAELHCALALVIEQARAGQVPANQVPDQAALSRAERLAIDYDDAADLVKRGEKALKVFESGGGLGAWQIMTAQGVFRGSGKPGKIVFLFPGQGSQYVNMLRDLQNVDPVVSETYREADEVMTPILGRSLTSYILVDGDESVLGQAEKDLKNTAITQPAVLTANVALLRLAAKYGFKPDMVIGHSLGEYAALVASGVLEFGEALQIVSARGREMSKVAAADPGCMAAVTAPLAEVDRILKTVEGYVVLANINSPAQSVIGGETRAVEAAIAAFQAAGMQAVKIPVSHAFHTKIVAAASEPLKRVIASKKIGTPRLPVIANVTGKLYPQTREEIIDSLAQQVASPVQFVQGMESLYELGGRIYLEVGPKRVLNALASDNLKDKNDVTILATNHPRKGGLVSFNEALCGLYAAGVLPQYENQPASQPAAAMAQPVETPAPAAQSVVIMQPADGKVTLSGSVVITGAGLGLPGSGRHVFEEGNVQRILKGEMMIEALDQNKRAKMLEKRVTRLVKSEAGAVMEVIDDLDQTIKLAGQSGQFNLVEEFGVPAERVEACDIATQLAIAAGIEALRDAGIPLVMAYRQTSKGTLLPDRWMLPAAMADETGVVFASAFPGLERMADEARQYYQYQGLVKQLEDLRHLRLSLPGGQEVTDALDVRIQALEAELVEKNYNFDRRFIFRILNMGHSQFAEHIGARGPNTSVNAACATTTHAIAIAEDWIRSGRCRRVVVIAGDDVSDGNLAGWVGTGLLASGAATTEGNPRLAILPFDRRRNGMIMGMGAAALVVEAEDAARERGVRGICELVSTQIANSAFHGTRLNVPHVAEIMNRLVSVAEDRFGLQRSQIAAQTVFVSHETYTPARGGSAAAEIHALRQVFGGHASQVVIANTKGFTGHTMGVGVEDVMAVKALEYQQVPPIAHVHDGFEPDPDLGDLNLSRGGAYPVEFALRLGAGFGSQIAMSLTRRIPGQGDRISKEIYQRWLAEMTGYEQPELEVIQHTLRVKHTGAPSRQPVRSAWQYGFGPTLWVEPKAQQAAVISVPVSVPSQSAVPAPALAAPAVVEKSALSAANQDEIKAKVLSLVSEKTGYPVEMLDLALDLEGDLGIDTVKQAELFAAVRTSYGIPRRENLRLSDYNTLTKVIGFVVEALQGQAAPAAKLAAAQTPAVVEKSEPSAISAANQDEIKAKVLSLVSEKTGYPVEMLDLELDLEGDLGIDTVKQAELFAAVRTSYGIPRREDLRLSDYNTLTKVIGFVVEALQSQNEAAQPAAPAASPAAAQAPAVVEKPAPSALSAANQEEIKAKVLSLVSEKTGYPVEMLDLELDLEGDLGIDTVKQAELFAAVRTSYGIPRREDLRLSDYNTLTKVIGFVVEALQGQAAPAAKPAAAQAPAVVEKSALSAANQEEIKAKVLSLVSEKTGYPVEMLDLELDLEGDLGIDTVKQAELFAAVRTSYGIPRREDLRLSDYNTLTKVIGFVVEALQSQNEAAQPAVQTLIVSEPVNKPVSQPAEQVEPVEYQAVKRRGPVPVLRPRLELCQPTGQMLNAESRVLVVGDQGKIAESLLRKLRTAKAQTFKVSAGEVLAGSEKLKAWLGQGPVNGVYFLPGLDVEAPLGQMDEAAWRQAVNERALSLYHVLRALPGDPFVVCATRMGGLHGATLGNNSPLGGLVSGLTKAWAWEHPSALVKVVDFEENLAASNLAGRLIEETQFDPGAVEIGWNQDLRYALALEEQSLTVDADFQLPAHPVFLVSGGTAGIIGPVLKDLAQVTQGTFHLLGRSPLPTQTDPDLMRLAADRAGLALDLSRRAAQAGNKLTPAQVEQQLGVLERLAAALETIQRVEQAGGKVIYHVCELTNAQSVQAAVNAVLASEGRVDVLLHAAGVERSRKLENKPLEEFENTLAVKVHGFFHLYKALEQAGSLPKTALLFSSVAGRFGNSGQTDYSAANDLLVKLAAALRGQGIRAAALDWGAWAEVGMASRGNIPGLMKQAGIEMLAPEQAAPLVGLELLAGCPSSEVVLAGGLGTLRTPGGRDGGMAMEIANQALVSGKPIYSMTTQLTGFDLQEGITLEAELDPQSQPFLRDHALNGIPILPGVMGIEGFSVAAKHVASVLASGQGGFEVDRLEDIQFMAPFKFYRSEPRRITWKALVRREAEGLVAHVCLESTMVLKTRTIENMQHFAARVYLASVKEPAGEALAQPPHWNGAYTVKSDDIYKLYFHGPAFQVLDGVQRSGEGVLGKLRKDLPAITSGGPAETISSPILVELCFQTAGIWEAGATGTLALPRSVESLTIYRQKVNGEPIFAEVTPVKDAEGALSFDARVVDARGRLYLELKNYRTTALPYSVEKELISPFLPLIE
jgi:malonyl CoA-acyl carrier protein transacylase